MPTFCKNKLFPELKNHPDSSDSEYGEGCACDAQKMPQGATSIPAIPTDSHSSVCVKAYGTAKANGSVLS